MTTTPSSPFPRLPHAAPFLLLDRIIAIGDRRGTFTKLVTASDPCLDHAGELPAAFVLEAIAQAGGALLTELDAEVPTPGYLAAVEHFHSEAPVRVGDVLRVEVELVRHVAHATLIYGRVLVGDRLCAEGRITLALPR